MKRRGLWVSIVFVLILVGASIGGFVSGTRPVLGLDLEGGVSVILSAPDGTPPDVMDQALENIRNRIDAFGTAEPILFVSGTNIEVQIPGLARGTVEERPISQSCLLDEDGTSYGCLPERADADAQLEGATVEPLVQSVCLTGDLWGEAAPCFGSKEDAQAAIDAIDVDRLEGEFCLAGAGLATEPPEDIPCFPNQAEAAAAIASIGTDVSQTFCVQDAEGETLASDDRAACYPTAEEAQGVIDALTVTDVDRRFCVVSSAGVELGCSLDEEEARARLQETGQERLLQVIGQTARLENREVLETLTPTTPGYDETPVTCGAPEDADSPECAFETLREQDVVFLDRDGETKYKLGPVLMTGEAVDRASAVFVSASQSVSGSGWQIDFTLTGAGAQQFAQVTTDLVGRQLAIVVDRVVISPPTVDSPITNGTGVITGNFTENRAKDLATQLNAGALPVALTTQQLVTVSPTLGGESLRQGLIAAVAGLILLMLYLLFYYRLLAVVAWLGMTIWAVLALGLVAIAGQTIGYALTLAGVAGLVISLGVTADSYIVFFERLKDEIHAGKSPRTAVQPAFKKSFRTIVAADIVTALAALVLYVTAISSVRGFALTLGVATLLDLFVVWFFKRPAVYLIARNDRLVSIPGFGLRSGAAADHEPTPAIAGASE